jgi:hypothetical protein
LPGVATNREVQGRTLDQLKVSGEPFGILAVVDHKLHIGGPIAAREIGPYSIGYLDFPGFWLSSRLRE